MKSFFNIVGWSMVVIGLVQIVFAPLNGQGDQRLAHSLLPEMRRIRTDLPPDVVQRENESVQRLLRYESSIEWLGNNAISLRAYSGILIAVAGGLVVFFTRRKSKVP
jgi:hypothetical protein